MNTENKELKDLLESIRFVYGYDFTEYAEASVKRRIDHFMHTHKYQSHWKNWVRRLLTG